MVGLAELATLLDAHIDGDADAAGIAVLDGSAELVNPLGFPLPPLGPAPATAAVRHRIVVTDRRWPVPAGGAGRAGPVTRLVPPTLVVGIGSARGVRAGAVGALLRRVEDEHGFDLRAVRAYVSIDGKAAESGILAAIAPAPLHTYPGEVLARVTVPHPSDVVRDEAGTPSVAEAAALHHAGARGELVVAKIKGEHVTLAVARVRPALVGPGSGGGVTGPAHG